MLFHSVTLSLMLPNVLICYLCSFEWKIGLQKIVHKMDAEDFNWHPQGKISCCNTRIYQNKDDELCDHIVTEEETWILYLDSDEAAVDIMVIFVSLGTEEV